MREKIVAQPELDFDPQMLKITQEFHSKYERISEILDQTPLILNQAHADLEAVAEEESPGADNDLGLLLIDSASKSETH